MAHIRKRGKRRDGSTIWQARIADPAAPGTTRKLERTFRSKQEAEDWLTQTRNAQLTGTYIDPRRADRSFGEVLDAFTASWVDLSPKTALRYESIIRVHLRPEFGRFKTSAITPELVQAYVNRLMQAGARPGTVRNVYAVLRNAFATAVRLRMVATSPCQKIKLPRLPREEMLFLSPEEVTTLADAVAEGTATRPANPAWRVLVYMAAYTGLRSGELAALRRQDVDLLRGVIHVRRGLRDTNGHLTFGPTKTHAVRTVTLPRFLRDMLAEHLASGGAPEADALVFTAPRGGPLRHEQFYARVLRPAVRTALPPDKHGLRFHDLRHTACSLAVAAGAHPLLVSRMMGHSSISITMDRYSHLMPDASATVAEALGALHEAASQPVNNVVALGR